MADSVRKPGVEITQVITTTPAAAVAPSLAPCLIGPAFEVVDAVVDGAANSAAVVSGKKYNQLGGVISPSEFPSPNSVSADERSVASLVDEISASINLPTGPLVLNPLRPSSFLDSLPNASRPGLFLSNVPATGDLRFFASSMSAPITVAVAAGETLISLSVKINQATAHQLVASVIDTECVVTLPDTASSFGAAAFIEVSGAAVNAPGGLRVFGSGLFASLSGAQTSTSTIGYSKGRFIRADLSDAGTDADSEISEIALGDAFKPAFIPFVSGGVVSRADILVSEFADAVTFSDLDISPARPNRDGDTLVCDGVEIGMITAVRATTIDVASINTSLSTYNPDGTPLVQRYTGVSLTSRFSPRRAYLVARGVMGDASTENAAVTFELEGVDDYTAASVASVSFGHPNLDDGDSDTAVFVANTTLLVQVTHLPSSDESLFAFVFTENYGTTASLVTEMNRQLALDARPAQIVISGSGQNVVIESIEYGEDYQVSVLSVAQGSSATSAFVDEGGDAFTSLSGVGTNATSAVLADSPLVFTLDHSEGSVSVTASSVDLAQFAEQINAQIGAGIAEFDPITDSFVLRSRLYGRASHISVEAFAPFDSSNVSDAGAGRPFADIQVNTLGQITLGAQILRNAQSGKPKSMANMAYDIGVSYRALRLDLSPAAADPGLLRVSNITDLTAFLSPIDTRNPLALAIYFALLNANNIEINAVGIDEVSSAEPEGTALSYARALEMIEAHEVYSVVPLSHSEQVIELCHSHVNSLSLPANKKERVLIASPEVSTRRVDEVASSGESASSTGVINVVNTGDVSLEDAVSALGFDTSADIPAIDSAGRTLTLEITLGGALRRYSVSRVSGSAVTVRIGGVSNTDGFFSTISITGSFVGETYSVFARGALLLVPGTTRLDRVALAETTRNRSQQYASRRHVRLFPDQVQSVLGGIEQLVPMYYYGAGIAGLIASEAPASPLTRATVLGFTNVPSYDLADRHLDVIAAGNMIVYVEQPGESPRIRMQCTTDVDAIENRELSIVKAVDYFAKTLRNALKRRVGRFNITQTYIDETSLIVDTICTAAVDGGVIASASITKLEQDLSARDTLNVEVDVGTFYPGNYIKVTINV